jgi:hypothetical protein
MLVHRFRELFDTPVPATAAAALSPSAAFVLCPAPVVFAMTAAHQAQVEYLYRLAFELAQAQVGRPRRSRWPAFSLN